MPLQNLEIEQRVRARLQGLFDSRERVLSRQPALLGKTNDTGSATVPGTYRYCYVRIGSNQDITIAYNDMTPHTNGLPVLVGYDSAEPDLFQVLKARVVYPMGAEGPTSIGYHHQQHEWGNPLGGQDVVYVRVRQVADGAVHATQPASKSVNVYGVIYRADTGWQRIVSQTVDLTSSWPSSGKHCWVLVSVGNAGTVNTVKGSEVDAPIGLDDIPEPADPSDWRLAAVWLRGDETTITDWPFTQCIFDGRFTGVLGDHGQYVFRSQWLQNGIEDPSDVDIDWDDATRTLDLSPAVTSFGYFLDGEYFTETGTISETIADTEGWWVFYIDAEGSMASINSPTDAQLDDIILNECFVAFVYWDATNSDGRLQYELHGYRMSPATHLYLENTVGPVYDTGMALADFVSDAAGDTDTHAQFSVATGGFYDEDLYHTLAAVASTTGLEIWYLDSANWRWTTQAGFSVLVYSGGSSRLAWNNSGAQTEVGDTNFVLCHVFATNVSDDAGANLKYIAVQGQAEYTSVSLARVGADAEIVALLGSLPIGELVPVGTVIFQTATAYTNSVKARVRTTPTGGDWIDWRTVRFSPSGAALNDHGNLAGLDHDDHALYILADGTRAGATSQAQDFGSYGITLEALEFDGASGANILTVPDNVADAFHLVDDGATAIEYMRVVSTDANPYLLFFPVDVAGAVGIDLTAVPKGGKGYAKLAINGTNADAAGPHVQVTTSSDDYPLFSLLGWTHDNVVLSFDAYFDGAWRSSDIGSNYQFRKVSDKLYIRANSGDAQGVTISNWIEAIQIDASGRVGVGDSISLSQLFHVYNASANVQVVIQTGNTDGSATISMTNDAQSWGMGTNSADQFQIRDVSGGNNVLVINAGAPANSLKINASGWVGVNQGVPASSFHITSTGGATGGIRMTTTNEQFDFYFVSDSANAEFYMTYSGSGGPDIVVADNGAIRLNQTATAQVTIGATAPSSFNTVGLTINQAGYDNEILALQSTDVAHGMTAGADTDTFAAFYKYSATGGGLAVLCYTGGINAFVLYARATYEDTTKSTSATGNFHVYAQTKSGTSVTSQGADANLMVIANHTNARFIFDAEGSGHADVEWTTYCDRRLKSDIEPSPYGLAEVMALEPKRFTKQSGRLEAGRVVLEGNKRTMIGFIAQDVLPLMPELVKEVDTRTSFYSLDHGRLVPVLWRALQEAMVRIETLEAQIGGQL